MPASQAPYAWQDSTYNPSAPLPLRFWPEYQSGAPPPAATFNASGLNPTWWDASWSTYTVPWQQTSTSGLGGGPALCAKIYQGVSGEDAAASGYVWLRALARLSLTSRRARCVRVQRARRER